MSGAHWSCMGESDNHQLSVAPTTGSIDLQMQIWQSPDRWIKRASPGTGPNTSSALLYSLFNHICFESFSSLNLFQLQYFVILTWPLHARLFSISESLFFCPAGVLISSRGHALAAMYHVKSLFHLSFCLLSPVWNNSLTPVVTSGQDSHLSKTLHIHTHFNYQSILLFFWECMICSNCFLLLWRKAVVLWLCGWVHTAKDRK